MENVTSQQILGIITAVLVLALVAPGVLRMNAARGTTMRNIALWLLIFVGLVWGYQLMHPAEFAAATAAVEEYTEPTPMGDAVR